MIRDSLRSGANRLRSGVKRRARAALERAGLVDERPAATPPVNAMSVNALSVDAMLADATLVEPTSVNPTSSEPTSVHPTASEPTSAVATSAEATSAGEAAQPTTSDSPWAIADDADLTLDVVQALFEDMVRPALQADGGDVDIVKVDDNDVYVRLKGACTTCPSSTITLRMGIERLLQEEFPQFGQLIQVDAYELTA